MIRLSQNSFFGGQLDYEMMGRQDYQRYAKGASKLVNFNIVKRGGLDKRRGFDRVMDLTTLTGVTADTKFRAIPFAYKKTQGFVLLMSGPKCIVVGTSPNNQFKTYNVTDLDGVYSASEIDELDYQQCGDTLFIAHQNHRPSKIEHIVDYYGEDGFHFYEIDLSAKSVGIPSITASVVNRIKVTDSAKSAALFKEHYKVSSVFSDGETFPCSDYSAETAEPWGAATWSGTNYPMPWTESQTIKLTISVPVRTGADGIVEVPDEVRIYKKAFSYFGLIGTKKITPTTTQSTVVDNYSSVSTIEKISNSGTGSTTSTNRIVDKTNDIPESGKNLVGYKFAIGTDYSLNVGNNAAGYIELFFGCCNHVVSDDGNSVTFRYNSNGSDFVVLKDASGNVILSQAIPVSEDKVEVCEREDDESASDFATRWSAEYDTFCDSVRASSSVRIDHPSIVASSTKITFSKSSSSTRTHAVVCCIRNYVVSTASVTVTFDDNYITPDSSITPPEKSDDEDVFNGYGNYPASVSLSQQRLIWASSINDPARIWMSEVGDFYNYHTHEIQVVSDAIDFKLPITRFAKINHICEMRKLLMFNSACEWLVDSSSTVQGLTYETIQAYPQSYSGSSERLKPIICNNSLIFCERTGQAVRRFAYDISNDGFAGRDVSVLSSSIFENNNIVDWTYQQFPYSTLWCVMNDGNLASFEFMEEQDIMAWMTHKLGGNGKVVCIATSYAVSPALDKVRDVNYYPYATHEEVFAVVKRGTALWLERMRVRSKPAEDGGDMTQDTLYHTLCLDGMRVLNSSNQYQPTTETGAVWIPKDTTTGATITRTEALAKLEEGVEVYEGFPFESLYESVFPSYNNGAVGMGQFNIKHVQGCALRLMYSTGGYVKPNGSDTYEPIPYFYNDPQNDHRAVFDGDGNVKLFNHSTNTMSLPGADNRDGRVKIMSDGVYPFSVLSYDIELEPETVRYGV